MEVLMKLIRVILAWERVKDLDRSDLNPHVAELLDALEDLF